MGDSSFRRWRALAAAATVATFALVVLGGVVRITGSGMGCGDDWPLCNGRLVPPMSLPTLLEYGHRLVAAATSVLVAGLAGIAWWPGRPESWTTLRRVSAAALGLLVIQVLLGAVTVWLELPAASVILHLGTAMLLLAVLLAAALHGFTGRAPRRPVDAAGRWTRIAMAGGFIVVLAGALVANLDALAACRGFPLCGGEWWPSGRPLAQLHWIHRLLAYGLAGGVLFLPALVRRHRPGDRPLRGLAVASVALVALQVLVGALMVTGSPSLGVRAAHMGVGAGVFAVLVGLAWFARRDPAAASPGSSRRDPAEAASGSSGRGRSSGGQYPRT